MNCLGEERLILLADGLAPEPAEADHLAGCSRCADALQGFCDANALVAEFLPPVPFAEVDDGLSFGPYTGCREIACGAMSRVYRGRDAEGREVAVKVCRDSALLDSFSNEVKMLQRCAAAGVPGVIPLLDARLEHLPAFIVTPYCPRGTLSRQIQEKRVDDELVLVVASGLAKTLAALAELGIVHGDLKASNILLDQAGRPCLADLGGARRVEAPGQSSTLSHKGPGHMSLISMSPEQARGQELSPASDIFSLGVILYQLATDRHPFAGGTSWEMASRILTETPSDPRPLLAPRFRARFAELLEACLAKDPSLRPAAAALVEEFLKIPEKPVNPPASSASLVEPKAPAKTKTRKLLMITLITVPLVAALFHFAPPAETAKPASSNGAKTVTTQASSSSISTSTNNGETTIVCNGKEVWKGPTSNQVKSQAISRNGETFAAAFDGDKVIWESAEGAGAKIQDAGKESTILQADFEKKMAAAKQQLQQSEVELQRAVAESEKKLLEQKAATAKKVPPTTDAHSDIPVNLKSLNLEYDVKNGKSIFTGEVSVDDGSMTLHCDSMTAFFLADKKTPDTQSKYIDPSSGKTLDRVVCDKNVVIRKGDQVASAEHAEYYFASGKIVLTGKPVLKHKKSIVKGSRITYYRDNEVVNIENLDANGNDLKKGAFGPKLKP